MAVAVKVRTFQDGTLRNTYKTKLKLDKEIRGGDLSELRTIR